MKILISLLLVLSLVACKNDAEEVIPEINEDSTEEIQDALTDDAIVFKEDIELNKQKSIQIKQKELKQKKDEKEQLLELVIEKNYIKEEDLFTIDFRYPQLNEGLKASYVNFNEYINDTYVDITGTEAGILEASELLCDTIPTNRFQEKRFIDYKMYILNEKLVSILFYKENFYSGTLHPTYSFDCLNFDLTRSIFMNYEDFFIEGSEEESRAILNAVIRKEINEGEMYYDCWEISADDFFEYKDNFVLDDYSIEYYFDDCVVCPSYTGSYSVRIPLEDLLPVLKRDNVNPLVF